LLGKFISITARLQGSLDEEKGKDLAGNLDRLYDCIQRWLFDENVSNDMSMVQEVWGCC